MRSKKKKKTEAKPKNKIFLIILIVLLLISAIALGYFCIKYNNVKTDNAGLKNELATLKSEILNMDNNYITYTDELNKKKTELKDKIEEYSIWLEMIEKVK